MAMPRLFAACALALVSTVTLPTLAAGVAFGVHYDVSTTSGLATWTELYTQAYSHHTQMGDTDFVAMGYGAKCVFVAAKTSSNSGTYQLGAFGDGSDLAQTTILNSPHLVRGTYWYRTDGKSFGFSADSNVVQNSADTESTASQSRLSWHLGQAFGGYRAGATKGLNSDSTFRKVILGAGVPCADVTEDYTFTVGGGGGGGGDVGGGGGDVGGGGSDAGDGSDEGDDPAPTGVVLNYDISLIRQWTSVYFREYKHATSLADVDLSAYGERCVFVGALNTEFAADYRLGAFAPASIVNAVTPHNSPSEYNGVWWYKTESQSFGFSADSLITQGSADTASANAETRLSWHLGSVGGYRAGTATGLNSDTTFFKVIKVSPNTCAGGFAGGVVAPPADLVPGIHVNVAAAAFIQWRRVLYKPYAAPLSDADVDLTAMGYSADNCVVVGAFSEADGDVLTLMASANADVVSTTTSMDSPIAGTGGVFWYNTPGKSFGFAPSGDIKQEPADSTNHLRDSRQRLSWHIGQGRLGGYRAGERLDLNDETGLKKVIYVAGVPCADVADDWSYSGPQSPAPYASLLAAAPGVSVSGVQHDVRDTFDASWTRLYDQPYSHGTSDADTNIVAQGYDGTVCVFVGAKVNSGATTFLLGAYAPASVVSTQSALNTPHEYKGVLWYRTPGKSFGFVASGNTISQSSADVGSSEPTTRLSWHMGQALGGYRAGTVTGLNSDSSYRKVILVSSSQCSGAEAGGELPEEIVNDYSEASLTSSAWTYVYNEAYSDSTQMADVDFSSYGSRCVFVGCKNTAADTTFRVGAFGTASTISVATTKNAPHLHRGVYWYRTSSASFGFSDSSTITQNTADTTQQDSNKRLSWHTGGSGGWRCGSRTGLNSNDAYRKVVMVGPSSCDELASGPVGNGVLLTSTYGPSHATIHDSRFTVTATFGTDVTGVTVDDFYRGQDISGQLASGTWTLSGSGRVWVLTVQLGALPASATTLSFEFDADAATTISPAHAGSDGDFQLTYEAPTVDLSSALGSSGHTSNDLVLTYTATFSSPVPAPAVDDWHLQHPFVTGTTAVTNASFSTATWQPEWVLTLALEPTANTMSVSSVATSVSFSASLGETADPKYRADGTQFTITFVPPTYSFHAAPLTTSSSNLRWVIDFSAFLGGVTLSWFTLPPQSPPAFTYDASVNMSPFVAPQDGKSTQWILHVNVTTGFYAQGLSASPAWVASSHSIDYRPPVPTITLTPVSPVTTTLATMGISFSTPVSGLKPDHFTVESGDMLLTVADLIATASGGCTAAGCDPADGSAQWQAQLYIAGQYQDADITVALPAGRDTLEYKNAASNAASMIVDAVDVGITADADTVDSTEIYFTVAFGSSVTGFTDDDLVVTTAGTSATATIVGGRRLRHDQSGHLRAAAAKHARGRQLQSTYRVLVSLTGNYTPGPVSLGIRERSVDPPNAAYPVRAKDGTPKSTPIVVAYSPPVVTAGGAASREPLDPKLDFSVSFNRAVTGVDERAFAFRCSDGRSVATSSVVVTALDASGPGEPATAWNVKATISGDQEACIVYAFFEDRVGAVQPPAAVRAAPVYTAEYATPSEPSNVGAIVGGVVGGTATVVIAGMVGYAIKKKSAQNAAAAANARGGGGDGGAPTPQQRFGRDAAATAARARAATNTRTRHPQPLRRNQLPAPTAGLGIGGTGAGAGPGAGAGAGAAADGYPTPFTGAQQLPPTAPVPSAPPANLTVHAYAAQPGGAAAGGATPAYDHLAYMPYDGTGRRGGTSGNLPPVSTPVVSYVPTHDGKLVTGTVTSATVPVGRVETVDGKTVVL